MAELTISPDEIRGAIEQNVAAFSPENAREEVGRVIEVGDAIITRRTNWCSCHSCL